MPSGGCNLLSGFGSFFHNIPKKLLLKFSCKNFQKNMSFKKHEKQLFRGVLVQIYLFWEKVTGIAWKQALLSLYISMYIHRLVILIIKILFPGIS
jgi:hypothetical protein